MSWELLNIIGTIAFAMSGAIVAMEEKYDLFGVWLLALTTAFGGGAIRNLLIGVPVSALWEQEDLFLVAVLVALLIFMLPQLFLPHWGKWGVLADALGLSAFAIQGALMAAERGLPISATISAAVLTGVGGGVIRDLLAGRKPLVLHKEIYAMWAVMAAIVVDHFELSDPLQLFTLLGLITTLRMLSYYYEWNLPARRLGGE
ncbi:trimeric intracellular cation channel family protein [Exiguobacterium flavidum]|uniref:trimeric intracellular cation channel family protein n=1 Tax=Exiguobacterium flavidum TaxID=2184695 RepID=UPI000DF86272|nr:trimeric intracellular cation channel family protein [Exiguobacterium flavidum]